MKKMVLLMALAALVCWLPGQALATTTYDSTINVLGTFTDSFSTGVSAPYGNVHVSLNTAGTQATITVTPNESPKDLDFVNGSGSYSAALNIKGSFTLDSTPTYTDEYSVTRNASGSSVAGITMDSLGSFNLAAYHTSSTYTDEVATFVVDGSWTSAAAVLAGNASGYDAAVWVTDLSSGTGQNSTAYLGEKAAVPIPPSALLLGSGLLGLVGLRRFRKS